MLALSTLHSPNIATERASYQPANNAFPSITSARTLIASGISERCGSERSAVYKERCMVQRQLQEPNLSAWSLSENPFGWTGKTTFPEDGEDRLKVGAPRNGSSLGQEAVSGVGLGLSVPKNRSRRRRDSQRSSHLVVVLMVVSLAEQSGPTVLQIVALV